jgi:periplasmic divalent cation tolerance protein
VSPEPVPDGAGVVEAHVTVPDTEAAERIARELVDRGQAACVQCLGPIASVYRWQGETHRAQEWLLLVKTTDEAFPDVCRTVQELHSYDVPEIIAVPVSHALGPYARWVQDNSTAAQVDA